MPPHFLVATMIRKSGLVADIKVVYTDRFSFDIAAPPFPANLSALPTLPSPPNDQPFSLTDTTTFGPASCTRWLHIDPALAGLWEPNFDAQQTIRLPMKIRDGSTNTLTINLLCQDHLSVSRAVRFALVAAGTFIVSLPVLLVNSLFSLLGIRFKQKRISVGPSEEEAEMLPAHGPNDVE